MDNPNKSIDQDVFHGPGLSNQREESLNQSGRCLFSSSEMKPVLSAPPNILTDYKSLGELFVEAAGRLGQLQDVAERIAHLLQGNKLPENEKIEH